MLDSIKAWLAEKLQMVLDWIYDFFQWLGQKIFSGLLEGLASVLNAIPVPGFFSDAANFFNNIPSSVLFFLNLFAVGEGIAMITAALVIRFLIRRIPIIG
ncbi:MAG TPA: DUF2523 family protein [Pseudomonas sp.]|uniref:DUF2523 family protein n=1 Tax=Pseudomonas sp. TaxID=306 RepID=UPI002B6FEF5F|nr:DUF2523 family protein [Pseudomonas sp.]HSX90710.1 DUF2523 family protein [Pseudomonas sp.]